jgi:hypothetical protein
MAIVIIKIPNPAIASYAISNKGSHGPSKSVRETMPLAEPAVSSFPGKHVTVTL